SRRRHTRFSRDWSSDVCSSDLVALGAEEQDHAALLGDAREEVHRVVEQRDGLLEIDDVDLAAGAEDVRAHLRVPVTGLVAEVDRSEERRVGKEGRSGWTETASK